jgi:hypothetical protein
LTSIYYYFELKNNIIFCLMWFIYVKIIFVILFCEIIILYFMYYININFKFFLWNWSLISGLCTCKADALLLEPHLQSILFWFFWRWRSHKLSICLGWPWNLILLISASQGFRITGINHWCLATYFLLKDLFII